MKYLHRSFVFLYLLIMATDAMAQTKIQSGVKVQVLVNNSWKEAVVLRSVAGRTIQYQVRLVDTVSKSGQVAKTLTVASDKIKTLAVPVVVPAVTEVQAIPVGRYELYSGIPSMNIGHFILLTDGKYKVAFNDQEFDYEIGTYTYHADTHSIEWLTGLFRNNRWGGKIQNRGPNQYRIEFNKVTFGDSR